ncbi:MAG: 23S rRNA pseudouridine synthase [Chloroflexi bacterium]|jgi:23S rRNA pseudouridine1911/1915/1917 synthase|nr:MAG: 23S rRNA pseudouridine synthase [Chloroflexota bacterium]
MLQIDNGQQLNHQVHSKKAQRLDTFVVALVPDLSRSQAQHLIENGFVILNKQVTKPSQKIKLGDQIQITIPDQQSAANPQPEVIPITKIFENDDLVVVDKAAGLVVHTAPGHRSGTLVNALLSHYPDIAKVGNESRPGLVHRLDAETSGLMVVARNQKAYKELIGQIKSHSFNKTYLGLVKGTPKSPQGSIDAPIARNPRSRQKMAVIEGGRESFTEYRSLLSLSGFTLLEIKPRTGRTHQIRVHFSTMGHPIAGDKKYGGKVPFLDRQFLHAHKLGFTLPSTGEYVEFTSELPADLEKVINELR